MNLIIHPSVEKVKFPPDKTLYLVDGSSFSYRAFFAIRNLKNSQGLPTGAIFGFVNTLRKIISQFHPKYLGVCFDVSRKTFRQEKFKDYKVTRPPLPGELKAQLFWIKEVIKFLSIPIAELEGFEADDLIATLAQKAKESGFKCIIFSSDKDILQIIEGKRIMVYNLGKDILYDEEKVFEVFGLRPKNIPDLLALSGDAVDNIPGVKGIGPKNATLLIKDFGGVDKLLENIQNIPKDSLKKLILDSKDSILLSKDLAVLDKNVPIDLDIKSLKVGQPNYKELYRIFRKLEFKSLIEEFSYSMPAPKKFPLRNYDLDLAEKIKESKELVFYYSEENIFIYYSECIYKVNDLAQIQDFLDDPDIKKISFDLKRTISKLKKFDRSLNPPYFDVKVAAFLLKSHLQDLSLENIIWEYLGLAQPKIEEFQKVGFIASLYSLLKEELKKKSLETLFYKMEMPLIEVLAWMEESAISIDLGYLKSNLASLKQKQTSLEEEIQRLAGIDFNLNSPKQLSNILFKKLKLRPVKKTKTGFSTNEESLNKLKDSHPIIERLLEYRKLTKLLSTYIKPFINQAEEGRGKIYPQFSQVSSSTGRLVSFSPNLQNIPIKQAEGRKIRGAFISSFKEGLILSADYSQIELRVLAHISKDSNLIEAFKNNKDIHKFTASLLFSKKEEDITFKEREFAKRINFAIVYGMSPYGLSKELAISLEEADRFISEYFFRYPKVKKYIDETARKAEQKGYVKTIFGRRRYLENITSSNRPLKEYALRQAINAPVQGTAADIIKLVMIKVFQEFKREDLKSRLIIQIHDELVFDVEPLELKRVSSKVLEIMENIVSLEVPLKVNIQWGRTWLKASK